MNKSNKSLLIVALACLIFIPSAFSQKKKVAVVTFYANKYVGVEGMAGGASLVRDISAMAKDTNFNLKPVLNQFHDKFFTDYSKEFPFDVASENEVLSNKDYKSFRTFDTSSFWNNTLLKEGYTFSQVSVLYKKDLKKLIEIYKGQYDGFVWVFLDYTLVPKFAVGGMGTAGIRANANIYCFNKNEDKVFTIHEYSTSGKSVGMVAGIPIIKTEDILPLCKDASDRLLTDLYGKLPKITRKAAKNL